MKQAAEMGVGLAKDEAEKMVKEMIETWQKNPDAPSNPSSPKTQIGKDAEEYIKIHQDPNHFKPAVDDIKRELNLAPKKQNK